MTSERALARSLLGNAISYTRQLWPGLTRFLDDARMPIDTNQLERGMRGLALGRKNHYGSREERGTQVAALFYSLLETAKLVGVEPPPYLAEATRRTIATPGAVTLSPRSRLCRLNAVRTLRAFWDARKIRAWDSTPPAPPLT